MSGKKLQRLAEDLAAEVDELREQRAALLAALEEIAGMRAGGPHASAQAGMTAALNAFDDARSIALSVIARATLAEEE